MSGVIDDCAELSAKTKKALEQIALELDGVGLSAQASMLRSIAEAHRKLSISCLSETQPINIGHSDLVARTLDVIERMENMSTDMLTAGFSGHSSVSEAVSLLRGILKPER